MYIEVSWKQLSFRPSPANTCRYGESKYRLIIMCNTSGYSVLGYIMITMEWKMNALQYITIMCIPATQNSPLPDSHSLLVVSYVLFPDLTWMLELANSVYYTSCQKECSFILTLHPPQVLASSIYRCLLHCLQLWLHNPFVFFIIIEDNGEIVTCNICNINSESSSNIIVVPIPKVSMFGLMHL